MKIAVIGWGSLIWDKREGDKALEIQLDYQEEDVEKGWHSDGPRLPIEFARISSSRPGSDSKRKRLTLIIYPPVRHTTTLWALSTKKELEKAAVNLCDREGTPRDMIGAFRKGVAATDATTQAIADWLNKQSDIDAAIWTNLPPNFEKMCQKPFTAQNAVEYLQKLHSEGHEEDAVEYIRRAPGQIRTPARPSLEAAIKSFKPARA